MPLLLTVAGILALILLIAYFHLDTFIAFILVAIGIGLAAGMDVPAVGKSIQTGIGNTLGELVLIIGFGAMLGRVVAESGAARRITNMLVDLFGVKNIRWGMALAGFIIGIPLFYNAGFIIVVPLIFTIAASTKLPMLTVAIPMLSALSVAHGYLPPHPSPAALVGQLGADLGKTLFYGIIVAIPAIVLAGPIFGKTLGRFNPKPDREVFDAAEVPATDLPGIGISFFVALLPVIMLTVFGPLRGYIKTQGLSQTLGGKILTLLGEPYMGMLISVLVAVYALMLRRHVPMKKAMKHLEEAIKAASPILLVIAGAGALKQIFNDSGTSVYIGQQLAGLNMPPLVLGWVMAALIRVCVGSATIAGLTTAGIMLPLLQSQTGVHPELMVLAIGAGSLMLSHINDAGFWLFKEYFNLSINDTLRTWTVMETIVGVVGLLGVLTLNAIL
ncbi:gluconate:H+ symporter [uncultured Fibrella sp.]|uniref:gluconate:H+ symporter n=1 Tax=uncultured Fibrella sp. TaxID=1284596 RepID=UPI0035CC9538